MQMLTSVWYKGTEGESTGILLSNARDGRISRHPTNGSGYAVRGRNRPRRTLPGVLFHFLPAKPLAFLPLQSHLTRRIHFLENPYVKTADAFYFIAIAYRLRAKSD